MHQSRSYKVSDALGVGHDARDEHARLGGVEVLDRQPRDVLLNTFAHLGDRALGSDTKHLREAERTDCLNQGCHTHGDRQRQKQITPVLDDDFINQVLRAGRQNKTGQPVDDHE